MAESDDWKFVFNWHIENFIMLKTGIDSPAFVIDRLNCTKWFVRLEGFKDRDCFFLCRSYDPVVDPAMEITLGASLELYGSNEIAFKVKSRTLNSNKSYIRFPHGNLYRTLRNWKENDATLKCTVWCGQEPEWTPTLQIVDPGHFSSSPLTQECYSVVDDGSFLSTACHPIQCSTRTRIEVFRRVLAWSIEEIDLKDPSSVSSIRVESALRDLGSLDISFRYHKDSQSGRFWIEVRRTVPDFTKKTFVKFSGAFLAYCKPTCFNEGEHLFEGDADETWELNVFPETVYKKFRDLHAWYKNVKLNDGTVVIRIDMTMSHEGCEHHIQNSAASKCDELKDIILQRDIQEMQQYNKDVTLRTNEGSVKVHRNILSLHSNVLNTAMRYDKNLENPSISDIPYSLEVIRTLVRYMYGHPLDLTPQTAPLVLEMADYYDVRVLFDQCLLFIKSNIMPETAPHLLNLAIAYNRPVLFDRVKSFIVGRWPEVLHTEEWEELMQENRSLALTVANEVLQGKKRA